MLEIRTKKQDINYSDLLDETTEYFWNYQKTLKKRAISWESMSYAQQVKYLRDHPGSKRRITANPSGGEANDLEVGGLSRQRTMAHLVNLKRTRNIAHKKGQSTTIYDNKIKELEGRMDVKRDSRTKGITMYHAKKGVVKKQEEFKKLSMKNDDLISKSAEVLHGINKEYEQISKKLFSYKPIDKEWDEIKKQRSEIYKERTMVESRLYSLNAIKNETQAIENTITKLDKFEGEEALAFQISVMEKQFNLKAQVEQIYDAKIESVKKAIEYNKESEYTSSKLLIKSLEEELKSLEDAKGDLDEISNEFEEIESELKIEELKKMTSTRMNGQLIPFYDVSNEYEYDYDFVDKLKAIAQMKRATAMRKLTPDLMSSMVNKEKEFMVKRLGIDLEANPKMKALYDDLQVTFSGKASSRVVGYYSSNINEIVVNKKFILAGDEYIESTQETIRHELAHFFQNFLHDDMVDDIHARYKLSSFYKKHGKTTTSRGYKTYELDWATKSAWDKDTKTEHLILYENASETGSKAQYNRNTYHNGSGKWSGGHGQAWQDVMHVGYNKRPPSATYDRELAKYFKESAKNYKE